MARPAYSAQLVAAASFTGGPTVQYTVPSGKLAVVRCISVTFGFNAGAGGYFMRAGALDCVIASRNLNGLLNAETFTTEGHWVINALEHLKIQTFGGWTGDFFASGYVLDFP